MKDNDYRKESFLESGKPGHELCFERSCLGDLQEAPQVLHLIFLGLSSDSPPVFISIATLVKN